MAKKPKNRLLLAVFFGLELSLLALGVYLFIDMISKKQKGLPDMWQLSSLLAVMIVAYLVYLKAEHRKTEDKVVGEKFRTGALLEALPVAAVLVGEGGILLASNARAAEVLGLDELDLVGAQLADKPGGELGRRLAEGNVGAFEAETAGGRKVRCTASPIGGKGESRALLAVLDKVESKEEAKDEACTDDHNLVRQCAESVAPVLERSSDHLASLAEAARAASPHEASRAAQLSSVAVRLLQAARRIRLAQQLVLIQHGGLKAALDNQTFDCVAAIRGVLDRFKALFAAAGVEMVAELPDEAVEINADRERVALAVRDLLEVCLAMTAAGDKVTVKAAQGEGEVEMTVTDTGCGMSREELEALFSTEGQPPVREDYTGGIRDGLFVAKEILEACGGQLWAESAPGKGTRFNLRIPTA